MSDMLLVKSRVQELIKEEGCSPTSEAIDKLNNEVQNVIRRATRRTKANNRKRVKAKDV